MKKLTLKEEHLWLDLKTAAEDVLENWERGDLAAAVRWLAQAVENLNNLPIQKP